MRIFIAGASGVIGIRLLPLLVTAGHTVAAMTRSPGKAGRLRELGGEPVVCDVFDAGALTLAVTAFQPDVVFHQLTDLPDDAAQIAAFAARNNRIRGEGTRNLIDAAAALRARVIAQSISWEIPASSTATSEHERMVLGAPGVVIRYAELWGPGTYYESEPPAPPRIHVDDAARLTLPALDVPAGVTMVIDDRGLGGSARGTGEQP
ncbi:MAG TPA: NAD-dependent epimerase/dehydratase family protein [Streptosporangiaceae bacterium]|nr:NAD-dependent epimerase/dehydratase family protein [Streptosporangiaceae bacterium]